MSTRGEIEAFIHQQLNAYLRLDVIESGLDIGGWLEANTGTRSAKDIDWRGFDLSYTQLQGVDFEGCDLMGVNFKGATIDGANFTDAVMMGTNLCQVMARDTRFCRADMRGAIAEDGVFIRSNWQDTNVKDIRSLRGACFHLAQLSRLDFSKCNLTKVDFSDADVSYTNFANAQLIDALLVGADVTGAVFEGANLRHAEFTGAIGASEEQFAKAASARRPIFTPSPDISASDQEAVEGSSFVEEFA